MRVPIVDRSRALRSGLVALVFTMLAACATGPDATGLRDQGAPIGVSSRYDAARFAGVWHVRGAYPADADLRRVERIAKDPDGTVWMLGMEVCDGPGRCALRSRTWPARTDVPGADWLRDPDGGPDLRAVVLWVDAGFRTAAVGDPTGRMAWVLDRAPSGGEDRIAAARQVLEFSGFALSTMAMRP